IGRGRRGGGQWAWITFLRRWPGRRGWRRRSGHHGGGRLRDGSRTHDLLFGGLPTVSGPGDRRGPEPRWLWDGGGYWAGGGRTRTSTDGHGRTPRGEGLMGRLQRRRCRGGDGGVRGSWVVFLTLRETEREVGGDAGEDEELVEVFVGGEVDIELPAADGGVMDRGREESAEVGLAQAA